jgi:hypothetical protein
MSFDARQEDHGVREEEEEEEEAGGEEEEAVGRKRGRAGALLGGVEDASCIDFPSRCRAEALYSSTTEARLPGGGGVPIGGRRVRSREQARAAGQAVDWSRASAAVAHRGAEVVALKYTPSGAHLVSCGNDGQVSAREGGV